MASKRFCFPSGETGCVWEVGRDMPGVLENTPTLEGISRLQPFDGMEWTGGKLELVVDRLSTRGKGPFGGWQAGKLRLDDASGVIQGRYQKV